MISACARFSAQARGFAQRSASPSTGSAPCSSMSLATLTWPQRQAQPKAVLFSRSSRPPTFAPAFRSASAKAPVSSSVMWSRIAATS